MLRLVATDLDGTPLRPDGSVSACTRRVLRQFSETGLVIVLVSARPIHSLREFAHAAGVTGLVVCSNGATVYDLDRDEVVHHTPLGIETSRHLILALREAMPGVCFAFVRGEQFACEPAYRRIARAADHDDGYLAAALLGDDVAPSNEDDGDAVLLERLLFRR